MLADNPDDSGNFPADSDTLVSIIPSDFTVEKIYASEHSLIDTRQLLIDGINRGAMLINFMGHGGLGQLGRKGLLKTSDVNSLTNGERMPILTAMTCVVGRYSTPGYDSLSESLILKENGGAIAVIAPTGLSIHSQAMLLNQKFFSAVFEDGEDLIGDAIINAYRNYSNSGGDNYTLRIYNLIGDPALIIK